ncbi:MAG: GTPase, partial [Candidatus Thermoplasmatota archaeon]
MDVLLVGLDPDLREMRALVESAGYRLRGELLQRRDRPDPRTFVGKGKLEDVKKVVKEKAVQAVVFGGALRPSQHYELEKALGVQCFDRLRVILEIFTQRAHGREAKLQVEFAMLQYEVPILREWIHAGAMGERPGFMAGGEYRVDAYYETVKRKMKRIRDDLEAIRKERATRREHRQEKGFYAVSLAGYANAGKSSLFNALSGEEVLVEDRLFTTLSTTTRTFQGIR